MNECMLFQHGHDGVGDGIRGHHVNESGVCVCVCVCVVNAVILITISAANMMIMVGSLNKGIPLPPSTAFGVP